MRLTVNGHAHRIAAPGHRTLAEVLREDLELTGTKLGCERGECGVCTVLLAEPGGEPQPVYACLTLAAACEAHAVTTVEGLAPAPGVLGPLQEAFRVHDAAQCGYCTPGQLMAATALLARTPSPDDDEIDRAMSGNLCRCGTYPKIRLAIHAAAAAMREGADGVPASER